MNIYKRLALDHERILDLFEKLSSLPESEASTAHSLIGELARELASHSRAEEAVFYNSLRQCAGEAALALHGFAEHLEIEGLLRTLQVFEAFNFVWKASLARLLEMTRVHFHHEEKVVFPLAQALLSDEEAYVIGSAFAELKQSTTLDGFTESGLAYIANLLPGRFALNVDQLKLQHLKGTRAQLGQGYEHE